MQTSHFSAGSQMPELLSLPNAAVQGVLTEVLEVKGRETLAHGLSQLARTPSGAELVCSATIAIASALLLAKVAQPVEEARFAEIVSAQVALLREETALADLALTLIAEEASTTEDVFRDRRVIPDALFARRLDTIRQFIRH